MTESTLQMKARFDRTLVRQQHTSVRYLVVEATAPSPPQNDARENPSLNLGVVIDASGSMDQHDGGGLSDLDLSRLGAAQQASEGIVQNLDARDTLSLVSFANEAICHVAAVGLDEAGKQTASTAIRELTTRGMTNLHDGWLSTGGGQTWDIARLTSESVPNVWVTWAHEWSLPSRGNYEIIARATDSAGDMQPVEDAGADLYDGRTGWHRVAVEVATQMR